MPPFNVSRIRPRSSLPLLNPLPFFQSASFLIRWANGDCRFGDRCNFAHGEQELRRIPGQEGGNGAPAPGGGR
jgi:hypothetical protein